MGAIHISIRDYFDTISEVVGIKSGILLTTNEIREILKAEFDDEFIADENLDGGIRIRSEVFDSHIQHVRYKIGNLTADMTNPMLWSDKLMKWVERGIDPIPVMEVIVDVFAGYNRQHVDPEITIKQVQERIDAPDDLIIEIVLGLGQHMFQSNFITPPDKKEWDGGTPLNDLFSCEIKNDNRFIDQNFLDYLAVNQDKLELIHWRNFERFCAEFFERQGYKTVLGPGTNDGGIDIRAYDESDLTKPQILIQCKRYKQDNKVDIETVKSFYTDVIFEEAKHGMIVTTSHIAAGGKKVCGVRKYPLSFAENEDVKKWANSMWRYK
jgi:restriction system protein